ncbi:hypothetical protein L3Q82_007406 [Scortum barcoo]|uniref:Uncharacterized protein n=1 Tax=Scortum barcoo TaxID=214431 RepID=A0ACB8WUA7_9TELE|nr:hypothetical protein L3Q82_007406 [Scortum barcoo]
MSGRGKSDTGKTGRSKPHASPEPPTPPDTNEALLASIRDMMEEMRCDIISKFETVISETVKREVSAALEPMKNKLSVQGDTVADLERSANDHTVQLTELQAKATLLTTQVDFLTKKCEDLEGRSRWNNVRLLGLPEGSEGPRPTEFMARFLRDLLKLDSEPVLDRAHRSLRTRPRDGEPPRPFVMIRVNLFQVRNQILHRAGLDETHALMTIVPEDVEIGEVEETLASIKSLGRVRVRGRNFNARLNRRMVLCESRETVREKSVPTEVVPIDGGEAWPVIIIGDTEAAAEEFNSKLRGLLQAEGKTIEDLKSLLPSAFRSTSSTESILHAVGDLLDKTTKPADGGNYGRLRMFSGALPTPPGEEPFDHWLEQAWLMVEETNCSDREKRRRLVGSVKGPALEIVKALRHGNPEASPKECLEALESAFGSAESGEDLYFAFRLMQQQTGEKLSDFLRRLERSLSKVIQRGGLPASHMNTARLEQLLRGAVASDLMLIQLRLRERRAAPPNFLQLLTEIRAEEEYEISRKKLSASVQQVHTNPEVDTRQADIQNLKAEIKELKSMVATVVTKSAHVKDDYREAKTISTPPDSENRQDAELAALKKELKRLKQKTSNKMSQQDAVVAAMTIEASKPVSHFPKGTTKKSDENFCYRCDKQQSNDATSNEVNCGVKKSAVTSSGTTGIPEGLVTIIFESWYHTYLPDVPIHPVSGLALWGLSESEISYPYRGDHGIDITQTLGIQVCCKENSLGSPSTATTLGEEDDVGCVLWQGPGPLTLPPGVGVLFQPMVVHSEEVNVSYFRVLVQNESLTETVIPVGTVIGHVYLTDAVIPLSPSKTTATEFDANLIDFGDSPVSEEWKERLRQKLSTRERSRRLAPADLEDVKKAPARTAECRDH